MAADEFEPRRRAVADGLAERKLDAFLVAFSANLRYLTGFTGSNGNLLLMPGRAILFTDPRYQIQARQETSCEVRIATGPLALDVVAAIKRLRLKRIGYEPARMTCDLLESLNARLPLNASFQPVNGWIETLRTIKSPVLALLKKSWDRFWRWSNRRARRSAMARTAAQFVR